MSDITERAILDALSRVMDPDLQKDIVTLGFVKNLKVSGKKVSFEVELTTPACPVKEQLKDQCEQAVNGLGAEKVTVNMTSRVRATPVKGKQLIPGVRNLIAVASGKGGVGKSTVCMNLALSLARSGARVGVLDCDIYGPSVPTMTGMHKQLFTDEQNRMVPHMSFGIKLVSMGFLIKRDQPVSWRGPMLTKILQQFLFGTAWGSLDYLLLDLPPGTGDVQLTITQQTPLSAVVLVTTPQDVALHDVKKGYQMFQKVEVPILGIIENMSYYLCPHCDKQHEIFKRGGGKRMAEMVEVPFLGELPLSGTIPSALGEGKPFLIRETEGPAVEAFNAIAGRMVAELSRLGRQWAEPGPGAMEV